MTKNNEDIIDLSEEDNFDFDLDIDLPSDEKGKVITDTTITEVKIEDVPDIKPVKDKFSLTDMPSLRGLQDCPTEYLKLVERVNIQYKFLPTLDFADLYNELSDLSIQSAPTPTLQVLNDELQKVQSAKDRLSEIYIDVIKCHNFKKRAIDVLQDAWGKFTSEKNAEGRKGDAAFRLSDFIMDFANVEGLQKACNHILKNLDSLHDSLSRRITIYQLTLKLQDIGRGALPEHEFPSLNQGSINDIGDEVEDLTGDGELQKDNF